MSENKRLFSQFPAITTEEWMDKIRTDLKGADFEKKLVWRSREGVNVNPFYRAEDLEELPHISSLPGEYPFVRGGERLTNSWYIRQNIVVKDVSEANKKALEILNRGVDSLGFIFDADAKFDLQYLSDLLDGIYIESVELNFYPSGSAIELLTAFRELLKVRGISGEQVKGAIEADPIGKYMVKGKLCIPIQEGIEYLKEMFDQAADLPGYRVVRVNGANFGNAGSTVVQELAMTLSIGNEYLSQLNELVEERGKLAQSIGFTFGIGSNYFFEIAKLRAARMLWATIVKKHGIDNVPAMNIHTVTSEWNKTVYDPYVNMLRTQTEAMSATLGGADSVTVNPFDSIIDGGSDFSERIARNQQLLLKEEAHFDKVVDPGSGSYYIENLTALVAEQAWDLFLDIEKMGGFLTALKEGFIQDSVEKSAKNRTTNVANAREKLLGTNIFANINEALNQDLPGSAKVDDDFEVKPLRIFRGAELFERLRRATEVSGKRPKVFMLTIGNPVMRKARAQFASNFFSIAGYEILDNIGFSSSGEGVTDAIKSKSDIVVICSSDEEYATFAPEIFHNLKDISIVVIAGAPGCEEDLRVQGIEHFISLKSDLLETLRKYNELLGIKQVN